jgi:hypothetical protein
LIAVLPRPRRILQYFLGLVALSNLFANKGAGFYSQECNTVIGFPMDSLLSICSTVLAYLAMFPVVYIISQIIVPSFFKVDEEWEQMVGELNIKQKIAGKPSTLSFYLKLLSFLSSFDWFYMKLFFNYASSMYRNTSNYIAYLYKNKENMNKSNSLQKFETERTDNNFKQINVINLSWFHTWDESNKKNNYILLNHNEPSFTNGAISEDEYNSNLRWEKIKCNVPSYFNLVEIVSADLCHEISHYYERSEVNSIDFFVWLLSWTIIMQLFSNKGRIIWYRVFCNYCLFFKVILGIWTDNVVNQFSMNEMIEEYKSNASNFNLSDNESINKNIEVKEKENTLRLLTAVVSTRITLLLLIPQLTIFSAVVLELAQSPIFVTSTKLSKILPPLIVVDPFQEARNKLKAEFYQDTEPADWEIYITSIYIFVVQSRLIQFVFNAYIAILSIVIIFDREHLLYFFIPTIIVFFVVSIIGTFTGIVLIHKFIFPVDNLHYKRHNDDSKNDENKKNVFVEDNNHNIYEVINDNSNDDCDYDDGDNLVKK